MDLSFEVNNQILSRTDENEVVVNKSRNYIHCNFSFTSSEWEGLNKFAIFKDELNRAYEVYLGTGDECSCIIPSKAMNTDFVFVSVYGGNLITSNDVRIVFVRSGYTTDLDSTEDYDVDIFVYMLEQLEGKADDADLSVVAKSGDYLDLLNLPELSNVAISGSYDDLLNKPTVISLGADVTLEQQSVPDAGYFATYVVKQGGVRVGDKLQIPKDYLLKSAEIKECTVPDVPVQGYVVGDVYFDFVFNTKDESSSDVHQYLLASVLKDVYYADNATLEKNGSTFKVKNAGITSVQLSSDVNAKLGYAEHYNSSACKNITANDLVYWNAKQDTSNLVTSFSQTLSDSKYPSEKLVKEYIDNIIGELDDWLVR